VSRRDKQKRVERAVLLSNHLFGSWVVSGYPRSSLDWNVNKDLSRKEVFVNVGHASSSQRGRCTVSQSTYRNGFFFEDMIV
jgi:hypothetical protein